MQIKCAKCQKNKQTKVCFDNGVGIQMKTAFIGNTCLIGYHFSIPIDFAFNVDVFSVCQETLSNQELLVITPSSSPFLTFFANFMLLKGSL